MFLGRKGRPGKGRTGQVVKRSDEGWRSSSVCAARDKHVHGNLRVSMMPRSSRSYDESEYVSDPRQNDGGSGSVGSEI